jgi:hypothetical protein
VIFKVLVALTMKTIVFWVLMPQSLVIYPREGGSILFQNIGPYLPKYNA